jgi:hypothetical protein
MPTPKTNETEKDYVSRCIPFVLKEPKHKGMKPDQAAAMCHSMFKDHKRGAMEFESSPGTFVMLWESPELYLQHMDAQAGRNPTTVQTLVMSKKRFPTKDSAKTWAKDKGFKSSDVAETTNNWRLRQRPPEDFAQESFRVIQMTNGVQSVIGHLK